MSNINKEINLQFAHVSVPEDFIIFTKYKNVELIDYSEAKILCEARYELAEGKPFYSLAGLESVFGHMSKKAQKYLASECRSSSLIIHEAIIVNSLPVRILVHYYMKKFKPPFPINIVKDYETGIKLLQELRLKKGQ